MKIAAVITETRNYDLKKIIERHVKFLPEIDVVCFHYKNKVNYDCIKYKLPQNIVNLNQYNLLMTSDWFWNRLPYDKVLIFQNDSGLLRKGIEDFLEYDFIGAPLCHIPFPAMNGGLSVRDVCLSKNIIENRTWSPMQGNEDIWFCEMMKKFGGNLPNKETAQKFSVETIFGLGSFGYHAIESWHSKEKCEEIFRQYELQKTANR